MSYLVVLGVGCFFGVYALYFLARAYDKSNANRNKLGEYAKNPIDEDEGLDEDYEEAEREKKKRESDLMDFFTDNETFEDDDGMYTV